METLPTGGKSPLLEKILKYAIPAALIFGGFKLWNIVAPTIIEAAKNFWYLVAMAVPAFILITAV